MEYKSIHILISPTDSLENEEGQSLSWRKKAINAPFALQAQYSRIEVIKIGIDPRRINF